jgi:hypothetical protein
MAPLTYPKTQALSRSHPHGYFMHFFAQDMEKLPFRGRFPSGASHVPKKICPSQGRRGEAVLSQSGKPDDTNVDTREHPKRKIQLRRIQDRSPASSQSQYRKPNFHSPHPSGRRDSLTQTATLLGRPHQIALMQTTAQQVGSTFLSQEDAPRAAAANPVKPPISQNRMQTTYFEADRVDSKVADRFPSFR